jgi:hypothetical protein
MSHAKHGATGHTDGKGAGPQLAGYLVEFTTPDALIHACEKVRDAGFTRWDAHTPFPVHGLDAAMGVRRTILPFVIFAAGVTGASFALFLQWWTNAQNYQFVISGKPFWSIPANIPVTFELTVLFSAFAAFFGMLGFNGLPRFWHPVFTSERFRRATTDRFFVSIEAEDPKFDAHNTPSFLAGLGGHAPEKLEV